MTMTTTLLLKTALCRTETTWIQLWKWMLSGVSQLWLRPPDTNSPHVFIHSGRLELLDFHLLWSPLLIRGGCVLYGSTAWNSSVILPLPGIPYIVLLRISRWIYTLIAFPWHLIGPCGFERVNGGSLPLSVLFMRRSVASCTQAHLAVSSSVEVTHANDLLSARLESKPWLTAELRENGTRAQSHLATRQPFLSNVRQLNTLNWEWVDIEDKGEEYKL